MTVTQILTITIIEALFLFVLAKYRFGLFGFKLVNMVLVVQIPFALTDYGIGLSNTGNLFFAFALLATFVHMLQVGYHEAQVRTFVVVSVIVARVVAENVVIGLNSINPEVSPLLASTGLAVSLVSGIGYLASFNILVSIYHVLKIPKWLAYAIGIVVCQIADSLVFFGAMGFLNGKFPANESLAVGFVVKSVLLTTLYPLAVFTANVRIPTNEATVSVSTD